MFGNRVVMEQSLFGLDFLRQFDQSVLFAINGLHFFILDKVMWLISSKTFWIPFYVMLAGFLGYRFGVRRTILILLSIALIITLADQTCATFIRPFFERLRPSHPDNPDSVFIHLVNGYRGGSYGFPSCHAANTAALTVFIILVTRLRWLGAVMITWMVAVCYSRMYLGVHYPTDILVGATVGSFYSVVVYYAYKAVSRRLHLQPERVSLKASGV